MSTIFWDDGSPSDTGARRLVPVWVIAPNRREFVRLLGPWRGVWLHWENARSLPCGGEQCRLCEGGQAPFWMGYAPALLWGWSEERKGGAWKPIVCPVTPGMAQALRGKKLDGLIVELHRPGRRRNGEVYCNVVEKAGQDPLPPAFDVEPILRRMWRLRPPVADRQGDRQGDVAGDGLPPTLLPFVPPVSSPPAAEGGAS